MKFDCSLCPNCDVIFCDVIDFSRKTSKFTPLQDTFVFFVKYQKNTLCQTILLKPVFRNLWPRGLYGP